MAEIKIADLTIASNIGDNEYLIIDDGTATKKVSGKSAIQNAVDLTNYATKTYVDTSIEQYKPDLTSYATREYVESNYANFQYVDGSIDSALNEYATQKYVTTAINNAIGEIENGSY